MTQDVNGEPSKPSNADAQQAAKRALARFDGWQNIATNLNVPGKDPRIENRFVSRGELAVDVLENLFQEDALFARIITAVPENATRRWIKIHGSGGSKIYDFGKSAMDALEGLDCQNKMCEFMRLNRLYGGSACLIGVNDGRDISEPIDMAALRSVDFLNVMSRWQIQVGEINRDPTSAEYGEPLFYTVGTQVVHSSRVLRMTGIQVSNRIPRQNGWGFSVGEHIIGAIRRFGTIYSYTEALFKDLVQGVMKIKDLSSLLSADDGCQLLIKRLELMHYSASAFNAVLLDDDESYERRTATFKGIREGIIAVMDELAAVAEMPLSILFGQPPAGLSTDDSAGRIAFYDSIANKQRKELRKPITRILELIFASKMIKAVPKDWFFEFCSLTEPTDKDQADKRLVDAQTAKTLVESGVITPEEARSALHNDPYSPFQLDDQAFAEAKAAAAQAASKPEATGTVGSGVASSGETMAQPIL